MRRVPPSRQVAGECALCRRSRRLAVSPCAERAGLSATLTGAFRANEGGVAIHSSTGDVGFAPADSPPGESGSFASSSSERVSQLVRDAVLSHQPDCPVCGSPRRRLEPNTSRLNHCIRAIPLVTPMRVSEIVDVLQAWLCEDCTTVYCDPWLSRSASAHLFTTGIGQHYDGWKVLYESVANDDGETRASRETRGESVCVRVETDADIILMRPRERAEIEVGGLAAGDGSAASIEHSWSVW